MGPVAIVSIQAASKTNSIHRGKSSVKRASPTQGGGWLAQTNYDALMTHHVTENMGQVMEVQLSWYLVLLSTDSITR